MPNTMDPPKEPPQKKEKSHSVPDTPEDSKE